MSSSPPIAATEEDALIDQEAVIEDPSSPTSVTTSNSVIDDVVETIKLALPLFLSRLSYTGMKITDSALLGHVSSDALSAAALSDIWTSMSASLMSGRVLSVLVGGAIGSQNPKLAGIYLQVAYCVTGCIALFVILCWSFTGRVWIWYGSDESIAKMAGFYAQVLAISIPGQIMFSQLRLFFSAQRIMRPEVTASSIALISNLLLGLVFVLGIQPFNDEWDGYGFIACPIITTVGVYVQCFVLWFVFMYLKRLHEPCWDGWSWKDITWDRIRTYTDLYIPAVFGTASDFWRVAVVGAIAARIGEVEVAVFNTGYRVMWIVLMMVFSIAGAASINISIRLGQMDDKGASQAAYVGAAVATAVLSVVSIIVLVNIRYFGLVFTNDETFLQLFEEAKVPYTITLFMMNLSVTLESIPNSMGRQQDVFRAGFIASWFVQVPAVIIVTQYWRRNDLIGLYSGMAIGYTALATLYGYMAYTSDWKKYAELAYERSEMTTNNKNNNV